MGVHVVILIDFSVHILSPIHVDLIVVHVEAGIHIVVFSKSSAGQVCQMTYLPEKFYLPVHIHVPCIALCDGYNMIELCFSFINNNYWNANQRNYSSC